VTCRVLAVSRSGYYDWLARPPSARDVADAYLLDVIIDVHAAARGTYGSRRVHADLTLGRRLVVGRRRVERLMRCHRLAGVHRRRRLVRVPRWGECVDFRTRGAAEPAAVQDVTRPAVA